MDVSELKNIVKNSKTIREVITKLGRNDSSGTYKFINKKFIEHNIDISHFLTPKEVMQNNFANNKLKKMTYNEIFCENSMVTRGSTKKRILNDNLKEYCCEMCGNKGEWLGNKITLILDHINGVRNDNRLENLRFLCPNCNATLETHCKGSVGLNKEKKIDRRTLKKNTVRMELRKVKNRPNREELKKMLNEHGYSSVGRFYNVSDNAVRRWAKNYNLI